MVTLLSLIWWHFEQQMSTLNETVRSIHRQNWSNRNDSYFKKIGWTPLTIAAYYGFDSIIEMLILFGVELDVMNYRNHTALALASSFGHFDAVRLLLSVNADASMIDRRGQTAFDLAKTAEIKQLFLDRESLLVIDFFC